ncbi:DNA-directed RNA polymerase III complex large subunit Rpc1 [Schizosaccharomyces cryophilus OY26]|uniref:DNA-directed RNA polymerase subunit n=1 Tax=Schizosaccharomyces cryophilus (strain OY26 / ATCC MYA-4695 / CBS 11777 / NBRC 106824 / NRRL Y48691) TaxID=653667 RepID=S9VTF2_SCHCR|nr:DNA-directed RNA polymerase III complex large subunit Rpc1 [Schizosaccharomyces cryophilus OY26]EPY49320.1 DNA-directed RNA polymerase III complex large subunit Rpc1 [Schizosaccharomyces cryophilus OY26]
MKDPIDNQVPKKIKHLQFGISGPKEFVKDATVEVFSRDLYTMTDRSPAEHGALDLHMGTSNKQITCTTCGESMADCMGHFGYVKLALPVFHIGYFKATMTILQNICKDCSSVLLTDPEKRQFLKELRRPGIDNLRRSQVCKRINDQCKKTRQCPVCDSMQGVVKKAGPLKIIHERFRYARKSQDDEGEFRHTFDEAIKTIPELKMHLTKAHDDLNPLKVLNLFKQINPVDCELLGMDPEFGRPENLLWQYVPAPPVCIRPSVAQEGATTEDDLTVKITEIVWTSSLIRAALSKGTPVSNLMEQWEFMQLSIAMYINSEMPGLRPSDMPSKPTRGLCQRLKGKSGRFRGNLSGKRVDFSGRTVISPDPNLRIDQVAVPYRIAKILTFPERVTTQNKLFLQQCIKNGPDVHPGANYIIDRESDLKRFLRFGNRNRIADDLKIGDIVERHLNDNDVILFNRQPSLHKLSIMAHLVKVRPWRTLRFNECVCGPYNADFDGDEMNLHVPQTQEAKTEALELMGVKNNLVSPRNGEPIIAATQDFITASYLLSLKDTFLDRKTFANMCCYMVDASVHIDMPPPAILKPRCLWTGKQLFSVLMKPSRFSPVQVNLDAKTRSFSRIKSNTPEMCPKDGYLMIRNSEIIAGVVDKSVVGDGKKNSLFYVILRDYGSMAAAEAMTRLSKMCARFMGNRGFSIGISDVQPGQSLSLQKTDLVNKSYATSDDFIMQYAKGTLETQPGLDQEATLEAKISSTLSKVRDDVGEICMDELGPMNSPLIMATAGSKGSKINVSQMVACVGQQIISGKRVPDGFQDRSLPHFHKNSKHPLAKGFVSNSFYSGLTPTEFLFHAISGREGLVDTAVKTAETGYMSRRLMKSLEDLSSAYDGTVRSSNSDIVQFLYGDDGLDPTYMEGDGQAVEFSRSWTHSVSISDDKHDQPLFPYQIINITKSALSHPRFIQNCNGDFIETIRKFVTELIANQMAKVRENRGLSPMLEEPDLDDMDDFESDDFAPVAARKSVENIIRVTEKQLNTFLDYCWEKYMRAKVEPGTAVGAVGAQSIGEPGTQMTLKTFHFAGVAAQTTLGVPRIKEIINAAKTISTPIISGQLVNNTDERSARVVKGRIEKTYLKDVTSYIEEVYGPMSAYIAVQVNYTTISKLQLDITLADIAAAIWSDRKLKIPSQQVTVNNTLQQIHVHTSSEGKSGESELYYRLQNYKRALPDVIVAGVPEINRSVINQEAGKIELFMEGYGLREVMNIEGIVGTTTTTNHVMEMKAVLGIEAARTSIISEIGYTMAKHGLTVDPRHIMLLGDVMTCKGEVLGITRFGVSKMKDSVLALASFEKTTDHLFDAAARFAKDSIEGISECVVLGKLAPIGTNVFQLIRRTEEDEEQKPKRLLFDTPSLPQLKLTA